MKDKSSWTVTKGSKVMPLSRELPASASVAAEKLNMLVKWTDPIRFESDLATSQDVVRLLMVGLETTGTSLKAFDNPWIRKALLCVGITLPCGRTADGMRKLECKQVVNLVRKQIVDDQWGTVAVDGRKMEEHAQKSSLLNFAWVSRGRESFIRSEDMQGVVKSHVAYDDYIRSAWEIRHGHAEPILALRNVAALCLDSPNVNKQVLREFDQDANIKFASVACGFHAVDGKA